MTPPSERCRYRTDKSPTFPYNRKKLLDFLEKVAKEDKDWEEEKPYTKEKRGKIWKPKKEEKIKFHEDESKATEWDEILFKASEAELVDLAAILGFHGMLNQVQYHQAFVEGKQSNDAAGFQSIAKYAEFKFFEEDPPNEVDIEDVIKKLEDNDKKLTELNLNNVKDLTIPDLVEVVAALKNNTHLTTLSMANTRATDKVIKALIPVLETNKTLKVVNVESNYISGQAIVQLLSTININQVVEELRVSNQRPLTLGVQNEMEIAKLVKMNGSLLKFNVFLNIVTARLLVQRYVQRNIDNIRRKRVGKDLILPMEDEKPYYLQDQQESKSRAADEVDEDDVSSDDSDSEEEEEE
ncbi:hypothetical protein HELRODRAFT_111897 [Helobdella robusta]|uniref:Tropomodulin n=1 Tax=Helobdella robusta TaxID=6412 RepID=T1EFF5_HELRO|nr:hypothetical protein HELRODRAFT_111897 [Helobdella robusta]ESO03969.1 hypothetical protein HELRODRAFT_111897 [Helobdella robusta]